MTIRSLPALTAALLLTACNSTTFNAPIETVVISAPDQVTSQEIQPDNKTKKKATTKSKSSFKYLSKILLTKGPCPDRDPSSYGILLKNRTVINEGKIICYYN